MATITEDYVSFETAKLLKEKGFDEECDIVYSKYGELHKIFDKEFYESTNSFITLSNSNYNDITRIKYSFFVTAPTLQMVMRWLREKYRLFVDIEPLTGITYTWSIWLMNESKKGESSLVYNTYEQACESAITYCLEHLI